MELVVCTRGSSGQFFRPVGATTRRGAQPRMAFTRIGVSSTYLLRGPHGHLVLGITPRFRVVVVGAKCVFGVVAYARGQ